MKETQAMLATDEVIQMALPESPAYTPVAQALILHTEDYGEWADAGHAIARIGKAVNWHLGDWMQHGERVFGEAGAQAWPTKREGYDPQTLKNIKYVAGAVARENRRPELPWSYHADVASLSPADQRDVLARCIEQDWTRDELRAVVSMIKSGESIPNEAPDPQDAHDPLLHIRNEVLAIRKMLEEALDADYPDDTRRGVRLALDRMDELGLHLGLGDD